MQYKNLNKEINLIISSKKSVIEDILKNSFFIVENSIYLDFLELVYSDFVSLIETNKKKNSITEYNKIINKIKINDIFSIFSTIKSSLYTIEFENNNIDTIKEINSSVDSIYSDICTQKRDEIFPNIETYENLHNMQENHQQDIEIKNKKIERLSRMAQMGEMISMIAHQWRQPLNNISMIVSTQRIELELENIETKKIILSLDEIASQVKYLSYTIDDFRHFFNPNKTKSTVNLNSVIDKSLSIIAPSLDYNGVEVIKDYHFKTKIKTLDNELIQVILNLLKNSQDALLENKVQKPLIIIIGYDNENDQTIEILDNGGGIPENIMDKIFDPYFTTKGEESGTGLGLSLAKTIIEKNCGGKLEVENLDECGVKFTIILPLS